MPKFFATTVRGLEDIASSEVEALTGVPALPDVGKVFFEAELDSIFKLNFCSRTLHRVVLLLSSGRFENLNDLYEMARSVNYSELIDSSQSFAVRAERHGEHNFTTLDIASRVGQAIIDSFMADRGCRLRVNLDNPDVEFLCLVRGDEFILGLNTTGESLHKRHYRVYDHPAALKTTIASAMIKISGWKPREPLLDPMCGGGTIPIEAALMARGVPPGFFRGDDFAFLKLRFLDMGEFEDFKAECLSKVSHERFQIYGFDKFRRYVDGAVRNARSAGVEDTISFAVRDAMKLRNFLDFSPEHVITNPPYGIRMRSGRMNIFYKSFLRSLRNVASGSTLTLITAAKRCFVEAAEAVGVKIIGRREVFHGDIQATIFKCLV